MSKKLINMNHTALVYLPDSVNFFNPIPNFWFYSFHSFLNSWGLNIKTVDLRVKVAYLNLWKFSKKVRLEVFTPLNVIEFVNEKNNKVRTETLKLIKLGGLEHYDTLIFWLRSPLSFRISICITKLLSKETFFLPDPFLRPPIPTRLSFIDFLPKKIPYKFPPVEEEPPPLFDRKTIHLCRYIDINKETILPYRLSEGCCSKCAFCKLTYRLRYKPLKKTVNEILELKKKYRIRRFHFVDLSINSDPQYLEEFCDQLIKRGIRIEWGAFARPNLSEPLLKKMAKAGCRHLRFGVESGSDEILKKMRKGFTVDQAVQTLRYAYKYGIKSTVFFLTAFPHESEEDHKLTCELLEKYSPYIFNPVIFGFEVNKGSEMYLRPKLFGIKIRKDEKRNFNKKFFFGEGDIEIKFDEIGGLRWEEKIKQREERMKELEIIAMRVGFKNWIKRGRFWNLKRSIRRVFYTKYPTLNDFFGIRRMVQ